MTSLYCTEVASASMSDVFSSSVSDRVIVYVLARGAFLMVIHIGCIPDHFRTTITIHADVYKWVRKSQGPKLVRGRGRGGGRSTGSARVYSVYCSTDYRVAPPLRKAALLEY